MSQHSEREKNFSDFNLMQNWPKGICHEKVFSSGKVFTCEPCTLYFNPSKWEIIMYACRYVNILRLSIPSGTMGQVDL